MIRVEHGDCRQIVPQLAAEGLVADAIITDPPYHLSELGVFVGSKGFGNARSAERKAARAGFMASSWDGGDIAFRPETWATIAAALKPGGYLLAFGGSRTHHRIWCAIEDAGLIIQDTILWLYGEGFPKNRQQLKPAFEAICVAYRPGGRRELQIDECKIPGSVAAYEYLETGSKRGYDGGIKGGRRTGTRQGRWPANVAHDGSAEVMAAFAAFGDRRSMGDCNPAPRGIGYGKGKGKGAGFSAIYSDTGTAVRFFYCAKAGDEDRWGSKHPTVKPIELLRWLVPLVTPPGGTVLDVFAGSGTTGVAALATGRHAILIEQDAGYIADIRERVAFYEGRGRHSLVAKGRHNGAADAPAGTLL